MSTHSGPVLIRAGADHITVLCPAGHLVAAVQTGPDFAGSYLEAKISAHQAATREGSTDRLWTVTCAGAIAGGGRGMTETQETTQKWVVLWFPPESDKFRSFTSEPEARLFAARDDVAPWHPLLEERTVTTTTVTRLLDLPAPAGGTDVDDDLFDRHSAAIIWERHGFDPTDTVK